MAVPRILLVNPNTSQSVTDRLATEARLVAGDRAEIPAATARFGAAGIETLAEATVAAHAVLDAVAARSDMDAVIVAAFMDPGLEALRESALVPAVGIAESGVRAAAAGGRRFAIVSLAPRLRVGVDRVIADCGVADRLVALRYVSGGVLDLARDRAAFLDEIMALAARVVAEDGAEAILFGGAVFAGIGRELGDRAGVPLYDGVGAAVEAALAAVAARPVRPPPRDPAKPYPGLPDGLARMLAGGLAGPS
ncbi:Asp/Glu/hydantoin racemase [Stella humosa]|uniref:Asp/Glu/hydantoin racemase n=1 Tax=Stella humosa TaxID=94 RepID=A0A3N1KX30_9PROT|nr:aspartate/glutamate racemase family protein [Stella humosa]ROP84424.1 Asp/Glu/hydantoin racemase [Stella humosa]BBK33943.1 Asp/Glu/hydantoin racemase [Stella humosa]